MEDSSPPKPKSPDSPPELDTTQTKETSPPEVPSAEAPVTKSFGSTENDWGMLTHLSGLCVLLSIPSFIGPLVFWLIKKDSMPLVDRAGKEAMNFQLTMLLVQIISVPLVFLGVGFVTLPAAALLSIIFSVIAGMEANKGNDYHYPLTIRFIR